MYWMAAAAALGAALKAREAQTNKKRAKQHDAFRRAAITYSPWTDMGDPGAFQGGNTDVLSGALQGGVSGAMLQQGLASGMGGNAATAAEGVQGATSGMDAAGASSSTNAINQGMGNAGIQGTIDGQVPGVNLSTENFNNPAMQQMGNQYGDMSLMEQYKKRMAGRSPWGSMMGGNQIS